MKIKCTRKQASVIVLFVVIFIVAVNTWNGEEKNALCFEATTSKTTTKKKTTTEYTNNNATTTNDDDGNNGLIFMHVGKTGGSSARCILKRHLREINCMDNVDIQNKMKNVGVGTTSFYERTVDQCHRMICSDFHNYPDPKPNADPGTFRKMKYVWYKPLEYPGGVIGSIRNPVTRTTSWFTYAQHNYFYSNTLCHDAYTKNGMTPPSTNLTREELMHHPHNDLLEKPGGVTLTGTDLLYLCYSTISDMLDGLRNDNEEEEIDENHGGSHNNLRELKSSSTRTKTKTKSSSTSTNKKSTKKQRQRRFPSVCKGIAKRCLTGEHLCPDHNRYGYQWYFRAFFDPDLKDFFEANNNNANGNMDNFKIPDIYVVRNEYKWKDFEKINLLLGGTAQSFSADAVDIGPLRQSNNTDLEMSNSQRILLCQTICPEIIVYKKILQQSKNLHRVEVQQSIQELDESCTTDTDILCSNWKDKDIVHNMRYFFTLNQTRDY